MLHSGVYHIWATFKIKGLPQLLKSINQSDNRAEACTSTTDPQQDLLWGEFIGLYDQFACMLDYLPVESAVPSWGTG